MDWGGAVSPRNPGPTLAGLFDAGVRGGGFAGSALVPGPCAEISDREWRIVYIVVTKRSL